jgi:hypothetical protein
MHFRRPHPREAYSEAMRELSAHGDVHNRLCIAR